MGDDECDDGNVTPRDGCSHTCTIETGWSSNGEASFETFTETCGDAVDWGFLECEHGGVVAYSAAMCVGCELQDGYECMHGAGDNCGADQCKDIMGDGIDSGGYACDDGNTDGGDGCGSQGLVEDGVTCTAGDPFVCTETCGDGQNMGVAECDDRNGIAGDGCDTNCDIELGFTCGTGNFAKFDLCYEVCGDGRVVWRWECDWNNGIDCERVNTRILCDDGNEYSGDGCDADCYTETGYECDGGDEYGPDTCNEVCGDGRMMGGIFNYNECDDMNTEDGDGCSSSCVVESGWTCDHGD
jgi:cysteine-rich repeat protein